MAERRASRRVRLAVAWALSAALFGGYYLIDDSNAPEDETDSALSTAKPEAEDKSDKLEVLEVVPASPAPGTAVDIHYAGPKDAAATVEAILSSSTGKGTGKRELEVLQRRPGSVIVRIPADATSGKHKLRLRLGSDDDTRSKPYDLRVKQLSRRKLYRSVLGGLALLVFGLGTMASGSRGYTGNRSQGVLAGIGKRTPAAVGLGVVIGGFTQFTTTAAGLVVGLIGSHLIAVGPAAAILLGAQLGAAALPSVLGLTSTQREGLLVVTAGVLWLTLADDRRRKAIGKMILGVGLLLYGLHLLRVGFEPLVSDPELLPYIDRFHASTAGGRLACVAAGIVLAALLQGPAPVFVLVLSLAQASGRLDLSSALTILSGTGLGAAVATGVVAWPFGREPRRLARVSLLLALVGTVALVATVDAWAGIASALTHASPDTVAYGKKVLLPHIGRPLVVGFALSQVAVTIALTALLPLALRLERRLGPAETGAGPATPTGDAAVQALREGLGRVMSLYRRALLAIRDLGLSGHRARGMEGEHALADARAELEALFAGAARANEPDPDLARLRHAAVATLQLQRAIDDLLRHAERITERAMALAPAGEAWQLASGEAASLKALHALLLEGLDAFAEALRTRALPDVDGARAREIRLNALEMEARQALLAPAGGDDRAVALRLGSTDLVNAYENVGNQVYRLYEALASEVEQDAAE
jgi:phosphate:Na+ symporter